MANRVGPIPPEKGHQETSKLPGQDTRVTEKGVEKVREIDPDEQRSRNRARQFQKALGDAEQRLDHAKTLTRVQSPFEVYQQEQTRPRQSPPVYSRPSEEPEEALPQSKQFWSDVDEPPDQPPSSPKFEERSTSAVLGVKGVKKEGPKEEVPSFGGVPHKPEKEKKLGEKKGVPSLAAEDAQKGKPTAPIQKKSEKEEEKGMAPDQPSAPASKSKQREEAAKIGAAAHLQKQEKHIEIPSPSTQLLPASVAPLAAAAATHAAPYLSPEVLPLFYQMVGTIHVMAAPPGISRTEIVLNSPSFTNSRFFGATITIEKYASAPNALNIRLSGSNQAVAAFNQNLPTLAAALDRANLPFQINRLEAVYATDRPVFRRKERGEERGDLGGGFEQKKGG